MKLPKDFQGRFELLELIHENDNKEIWRVAEIATKKIFALRIMYRTNLIYNEIATVKHQNLPEIFSVIETDFATYVVEEFLRGETLADHIKKHSHFNEENVCRIALEICSCLEVLHARHIIHRDIKPENIFLTDAGIFKLIDFDAARIEKAGAFADTNFLGTPGYAAPEQYGFQQTDERTDIYSLGLTLKKLAGYEEYNGFLTPIFSKCASFDPDKRYNSAKDLKFAIIRCRRFHKWRKFFILSATILGVYFFATSINRTENISVKPLPPVEENISDQKVFDAAENSPKIDDKPPITNFPQIIYPEDKNANSGEYAPLTPNKNLTVENFDAEKIVAEKIVPKLQKKLTR